MPKVDFDDFSVEELCKMALAKGIQCSPLADNREDIIGKLKDTKKPSQPDG